MLRDERIEHRHIRVGQDMRILRLVRKRIGGIVGFAWRASPLHIERLSRWADLPTIYGTKRMGESVSCEALAECLSEQITRCASQCESA